MITCSLKNIKTIEELKSNISIQDIATALSQISVFNGHAQVYSLGQFSIILSLKIESEDFSKYIEPKYKTPLALYALLFHSPSIYFGYNSESSNTLLNYWLDKFYPGILFHINKLYEDTNKLIFESLTNYKLNISHSISHSNFHSMTSALNSKILEQILNHSQAFTSYPPKLVEQQYLLRYGNLIHNLEYNDKSQ